MPRINNNIQSMLTASALKRTERTLTTTLEKLSTGRDINRSSDNAAGLSVAEQLRTQVNGLTMGNRNIQDGVSLLNVAEGALIEIENILQRMRELSIQSSTATVGPEAREFVQMEVEQLSDEIDRIAAATQFNKKQLLNGNSGNPDSPDYNAWGDEVRGGFIHIGANNIEQDDIINIKLRAANTFALGIRDNATPPAQLLDMSTQAGAQAGIELLDKAIDFISEYRADLGAYTNRLEHSLTNQENMIPNVASAESLIRDADFAKETAEFQRLQILQQASSAMLAQANSLPNTILSLLNQ
ncbi:MAG: flagellin [Chitinivibrionia bacterium]|nr:flagellin [Chitinivibrionia bacterium]